MNEEDYHELEQEQNYESYGGKDSGYCICGLKLSDENLCSECDEEEVDQIIADAAFEETGRLA